MKTSPRKSTLGKELIEGLSELADALESGERLAKRFTVRHVKLDGAVLEPRKYSRIAVRKTRHRLGVSQSIFAQMLGVSTKLVQAWEQGTRNPERIARHVLDDINQQPGKWLERLSRASSMSQGTSRRALARAS